MQKNERNLKVTDYLGNDFIFWSFYTLLLLDEPLIPASALRDFKTRYLSCLVAVEFD
jgi:hypothetical protein